MRKELEVFLENYMRNYDENAKLDQSVLECACGYDEWEKNFRDRSARIREIFKSNEEAIAELRKVLEQPMDGGLAADLFETVQTLYGGFYDDLYVLGLLCEPLLSYYGEKGDVEKLIYLYAVMGFETYEFYGRIAGTDKDISTTIDYYKKVISLSSHYKEIGDASIRQRIFSAYSNMIAPIGQFNEEVRRDTFHYYEEAYQLFYDSIAPMGDMTRKDFLNRIDLGALSLGERLNELGEEDIRKFAEMVRRLKQDPDFEDTEGNLYRAEQSLAIHYKEKTVNEVLEEHLEYIRALPYPDFEGQDGNTAFNYAINFFNSAWVVFELFDNFQVPKEEQKKYTAEFVDIVTKALTHIPYSFMTATFNDVCVQWFIRAERYLTGFEKKRQLLFDMILCRQPATYIHSLMVKELAVMIAKKMLEKNPEYFGNGLKKEPGELLEFIGECAVLHDIGKCAVADVINKQARKLTDFEFGIIKLHPKKALEILNNDPDFLPYMDVMLGHHKTYNGQFGYPADFDNRGSKMAPVVDLITICDAMDAATDIYGRNYTGGKNFDTLYQELVEGKGVKYCPEVVELIGGDAALYAELKELTATRRGGIYYEVYREITRMKAPGVAEN